MENKNNEIEEEPENTTQKYSLAELEDLLTQGKVPPGIKEYNDNPPEHEQVQSESKIERAKKVIL
jgi:hypothetical protein